MLGGYFIDGFCIGCILFIVLQDIANAVFCNSWLERNLFLIVLRLNKLTESIVSLYTRLVSPSTNFLPLLHCIHHLSRVIDTAREEPFPLT
jgi:hypothetical protein